ncbi:MAG: glycoside hydrolase family 97 C-terminal domain-containing protein, partial [Phaeodactylibacter sp.]|nr:glycoside hydrolase family 97 C-terminal domain-containing protein [Phaeodactylibacter sp.]
DWYIGAMTDWSSRQLEISLDFLPEGQYQALIYQDGPNAGRFAEDFQQARREVSSGEKLVIPLAPGGGWVARLVKQ